MRDWNGHVSSVTPIQANATTTAASRQPIASISGGSARPPIMPPSGTPACLTENIRLRCRGGVKRVSTSLPAGLAVPLPSPTQTQASSASGIDGTR